jgi:arylsulfatase A-like enzyme
MTGGSWDPDEWDTKGTSGATDDESMFSPWMRRDECLDIAREADELFADFINLLKEKGVYDNSIIVVLADHGMENLKDQDRGYEVLDLRRILRAEGLVHYEDYLEGGGTEINFIWCDDEARLEAIEEILESYTVDDPELGPVQPLLVVSRQEMIDGITEEEIQAKYGENIEGRVRPMELYSEYWVNHPDEPNGQMWPDLCIFPFYNYNVAAHGHIFKGGINPIGISLGNLPDNLELGFPAAHGGLQTARIPLIFKAPTGDPDYEAGGTYGDEVEVGDIAPTIYQILGWTSPDCVDGSPLPPPSTP